MKEQMVQAGNDLITALLEADKLGLINAGGSSLNPTEVMKEAIKQGNKNISLTTLRLKKKRGLKDGKDFRDYQFDKLTNSFTPINYQGAQNPINQGMANKYSNLEFGPQNPLGALIVPSPLKLADITIYHVEKNVTADSAINKCIK